MDGGVLVSGYEPALVGGPDEGVNAVGVGKFFLEEKVVGVPELHAAEVRGRDAAALARAGVILLVGFPFASVLTFEAPLDAVMAA